MSHVFHRSNRAVPPVAVRGEGVYLYDADGRRYIDGSGGAAVSCLGHGDPDVIAAVQAQAGALAYAHTGYFTSEPAEALADLLAEAAPGDLDFAYFVSGGSEGVEAALKLARQYFVERGEPQRRYFIGRRQSYHGTTLGTLSVGGNAMRRAPFEPILLPSHAVSPCYAYRDRRPEESEADYGERLARELDARIRDLGSDAVIAFIAETVTGATLGTVPPVPGYLARVREVCDRYGVLLILDEVMCGMGRTGTLFACEAEGVVPDIAVVAKGLGGGYQPIGAVIASRRIHETITRGSGAFMHGHTYLAHPMAAAAALAVQSKIRDHGLVPRVRALGDVFRSALEAAFGQNPHVGDIRGRGLFQSLELVADRESKAPFDPALKLHQRVKAAALAEGLICYPNGGTVDGRLGDHVMLAPPFIVEQGHLDEIVDKLGRALRRAVQDLPARSRAA